MTTDLTVHAGAADTHPAPVVLAADTDDPDTTWSRVALTAEWARDRGIPAEPRGVDVVTNPSPHKPPPAPHDDPVVLRRMLGQDAYTAAVLQRAADSASADLDQEHSDMQLVAEQLLSAVYAAIAALNGTDPVRLDAVHLAEQEQHRRAS